MLVETTSLGFSAMEIPDLIAGLMYGLTTENHLLEIESCYEGGVSIDQYVKDGIADLHKGGADWELQAVLEFGLAALNVPVALHTCESMGDDLKAIEGWGSIFKHPEQLTTTVTKNYLLHRKAITADIGTLKTNFAAHEYFKAGVDIANLLEVAIGPITVTPTMYGVESNDLMMIPDFIAGFFYGFTEVNNLTEIEACYAGGKLDVALFDNAFKDLENGQIIAACKALSVAMDQLSQEVSACKLTSMSADVIALEQWAAIFKSPTKLITTVGTHYELHKRGIHKDITTEKGDFATGKYFDAGVETADILELLLGPVEPKPKGVEAPSFTITEIPDFVAGLLYGWTGDNNLTELEACWTSDLPIMDDFRTSLVDLAGGNIIKAVKQFEKAIFNLQTAMVPCHQMQDDIAAIDAWAAMFKEPAHLLEVVGTHWELHKRGIKKDIALDKEEFAAGEYFKAGETTADAITLLLGKVQA